MAFHMNVFYLGSAVIINYYYYSCSDKPLCSQECGSPGASELCVTVMVSLFAKAAARLYTQRNLCAYFTFL